MELNYIFDALNPSNLFFTRGKITNSSTGVEYHCCGAPESPSTSKVQPAEATVTTRKSKGTRSSTKTTNGRKNPVTPQYEGRVKGGSTIDFGNQTGSEWEASGDESSSLKVDRNKPLSSTYILGLEQMDRLRIIVEHGEFAAKGKLSDEPISFSSIINKSTRESDKRTELEMVAPNLKATPMTPQLASIIQANEMDDLNDEMKCMISSDLSPFSPFFMTTTETVVLSGSEGSLETSSPSKPQAPFLSSPIVTTTSHISPPLKMTTSATPPTNHSPGKLQAVTKSHLITARSAASLAPTPQPTLPTNMLPMTKRWPPEAPYVRVPQGSEPPTQGSLVTRSSEWKWGDQDGGNGCMMVVIDVSLCVCVQDELQQFTEARNSVTLI